MLDKALGIEDRSAGDVARQNVRRALHPLELPPDGLGQRPGQGKRRSEHDEVAITSLGHAGMREQENVANLQLLDLDRRHSEAGLPPANLIGAFRVQLEG